MLAQAAEFSPGSFAFLALIAVVTFVLLMRVQRQLKRSQSADRPGAVRPSERHDPSASFSGGQRERWEVQMHDLARDLMAQLDTKARIVQDLLRRVDERIAQLERLQPDEPRPIATPPRVEAPLSVPAGRRQEAIFARADRGASNQDIAQELDLPIGEVELILSLRRSMSL